MDRHDRADGPREVRTFLRRALQNATASAGGTLATAIVQFLFAGLTIRYLGAGRAGFFLALSTLTGLNGLFGDLGLAVAATRQVAMLRAEGRNKEASETVATVSVISGLTALVLALILVLAFDSVFRWSRLDAQYYHDARLATLATLAGFVLTQLTSPWRATYGALQRYEILGAMNTVSGLASGIGGIVILNLMPWMAPLAIVRTSVTALRAFVDSRVLRRLLGATPWPRLHLSRLGPLLHFSAWIYADTVGGTLLYRANSLVLTQFVGSAALPYYELPQRAYSQIHGILASQSQFLLPLLSSYGGRAADQVRKVEDRLRWLVAVAGVNIYAPMALIGPAVISHIVNPAFGARCAPLLYLACVQGLFQAVDVVPYYSSLALGSAKQNSLAGLLQGLAVAATALLLIPRVGMIGAGYAQMWVIPVVILHTMWVARLIPRQADAASRSQAYLSPACMLVTWLLVAWAAGTWATGLLARVVAVVLGGSAAWLVLAAVERRAFPTKGRIEILGRILRELSGRVLGLKRAAGLAAET